RFSPDERIPADALVTVQNAQDAAVFFGVNSPEAKFATKYFGYISPAPASQADSLQFARVLEDDAPAQIVGTAPDSLSDLTQIADGELEVIIDGTPSTISGIDLTD